MDSWQMNEEDEKLAKAAYNAYGESVGWKNYQGNPMPIWDGLTDAIKEAWFAACLAVIKWMNDAR